MSDYDIAAILREGVELEGAIRAAGQSAREQAKGAYGTSLLDGRIALMGLCARLMNAYNGVARKTDESISNRLVLLAAAIQGAGATEDLISEGQYFKAATALKQDMEVVVRIHETIAGRARSGGTPQLKYLQTAGAKKFYGELNDLAHPSQEGLIAKVVGTKPINGATGVSPIPVFVPEIAKALYQLHVYLLVETSRELIRLFIEVYGEDEKPVQEAVKMWLGITAMLETEGNLIRE
jgi:hypothetical protein